MSLTSPYFILFCALFIAVYYLIPKRGRQTVLLAASLLFYACGGIGALVYIIVCSAVTYGSALMIERLRGNSDAATGKKRARYVVAACALFSFGLLFAVKYWDWLAEISTVSFEKLEFGFTLPHLGLLVPLGISFYIFKSMGYVIDIYRKKYSAERNPIRYLLFISYFPQVVQGPISRYNDLAAQLESPNQNIADNLRFGIQLAFWGYLKKLVIADRAAVLVNTVLSDAESYGGALTLTAILFYCIQLYCDFSGGIDIARGVSGMFGVNMVENFRRPLFADSLADFWRRWHITLGSWMRDYIFYPLSLSHPFVKLGKFTRSHIGGKLGKIIPTSCATFIIYFIIGIWHGASFKYIAFGFWNGIIITLALLLEPVFSALKAKLRIHDDGAWRIVRIIRTNVIVITGRYLTRANGFRHALSLWVLTLTSPQLLRMFDGTFLTLGLSVSDFAVIAVGALVIFLCELHEERSGENMFDSLAKQRTWVQLTVIVLAVTVMIVFGIYRGDYISSEFIYKQF